LPGPPGRHPRSGFFDAFGPVPLEPSSASGHPDGHQLMRCYDAPAPRRSVRCLRAIAAPRFVAFLTMTKTRPSASLPEIPICAQPPLHQRATGESRACSPTCCCLDGAGRPRELWWAIPAGFSAKPGRGRGGRTALAAARPLGPGAGDRDSSASAAVTCWRPRRRWSAPGRRMIKAAGPSQTLSCGPRVTGKNTSLASNLTPADTTALAASAPSCNPMRSEAALPRPPLAHWVNQTRPTASFAPGSPRRTIDKASSPVTPLQVKTGSADVEGPVKRSLKCARMANERAEQVSYTVTALISINLGRDQCPAPATCFRWRSVTASAVRWRGARSPPAQRLQMSSIAVGASCCWWGSSGVLDRSGHKPALGVQQLIGR